MWPLLKNEIFGSSWYVIAKISKYVKINLQTFQISLYREFFQNKKGPGTSFQATLFEDNFWIKFFICNITYNGRISSPVCIYFPGYSGKCKSLINAYCSWCWLVLEVETPDQSVLQLMLTFIRSQNAWHRYIFIPMISVYCSWWWFILEVEMPDMGIYLCLWLVRTAADDDLYQ